MNTPIVVPADQTYSPSLRDFCALLETCSRQTSDPRILAALCERQAETLRISRADVSLDTVDLLLDTMQNVLNGMAEVKESQRLTTRMKAALSGKSLARASGPQPMYQA